MSDGVAPAAASRLIVPAPDHLGLASQAIAYHRFAVPSTRASRRSPTGRDVEALTAPLLLLAIGE